MNILTRTAEIQSAAFRKLLTRPEKAAQIDRAVPDLVNKYQKRLNDAWNMANNWVSLWKNNAKNPTNTYDFVVQTAQRLRENMILPLHQSAINLRTGFIFGSGFNIVTNNTEDERVIDRFMNSLDSQLNFSTPEMIYRMEQTQNLEGNDYFVLITVPGQEVRVRNCSVDDIIYTATDPKDGYVEQYYIRQLPPMEDAQDRELVAHPSLHLYHTLGRNIPSTITIPETMYGITLKNNRRTVPVRRDQPIYRQSVNIPSRRDFLGIGDLASVDPFAQMYSQLIADWWADISGILAVGILAQGPANQLDHIVQEFDKPSPGGMGGGLATSPNWAVKFMDRQNTIISETIGRPLASAYAAGSGLSMIHLLGDPGQSGARATAETLDFPNIVRMESRQKVHGKGTLRIILAHVLATMTNTKLDISRVDVVFPSLHNVSPAVLGDSFSKIANIGRTGSGGVKPILDDTIATELAKDVIEYRPGKKYG